MTISPIIRPVIRSVIRPVSSNNGFYPNQLPNAAIGLDAFVIPMDATLISSWLNAGNTGVGNAVQATALRQPLYVANGINGRPAVRGRHDGVNASQLNIADSAGLDYTQFTFYVVYQRTVDTGITETILGKWTSANNTREHRLVIEGDDSLQLPVSSNGLGGGSVTSVVSSISQTVNVPRIVRAQYNGAELQLQTRGNTQQTVNYSAGVFNGTSPYHLFARPDFLDAFAGLIGEFWFFTRSLNTNERTLIENYLAAKWGFA